MNETFDDDDDQNFFFIFGIIYILKHFTNI